MVQNQCLHINWRVVEPSLQTKVCKNSLQTNKMLQSKYIHLFLRREQFTVGFGPKFDWVTILDFNNDQINPRPRLE